MSAGYPNVQIDLQLQVTQAGQETGFPNGRVSGWLVSTA